LAAQVTLIVTGKTMQLIRCTKKLQKEMGLSKASLSESEPADACLGSWHANLIFIARRKCVLFVNDKTLFNFIVPDVSRAQLKALSGLFVSWLACVLAEEEIPEYVREKIMAEYSQIEYANTNSKSILGSMNDLAYHYEYLILSEGGVHSPAVPGIIKRLNHMPMGAIKYRYPIEALKTIYANILCH
jgi:hypothetical protein